MPRVSYWVSEPYPTTVLRGAKSAKAVLKVRREQRSDFLGGRNRLRSAWFGLGPMIPEVSWCGKMASRAKECFASKWRAAKGPNARWVSVVS